MNQETNAFQDLCYHYTWQLSLMLLGAWFLGLLFWYVWWLRKKKSYTSQIIILQKDNLDISQQIGHQETSFHEVLTSKEQIENDYKALQNNYGGLLMQKRTLEEENENLKAQLFAAEEELEAVEEQDFHNNQEEESGSQETDDPEDLSSGENSEGLKNGQPEESADYTADNQQDLDITQNETLEYNSVYNQLSRNDLKIIEGIGPKLEAIMKDQGIQNWEDLSKSSVQELRQILGDAGPNYRLHNPETWVEQAQLAVNNQWDQLVAFQQGLTTGEKNIASGHSKVEKIIARLLGFTQKPNDLKIVEGIGPKIEQLLKAAGIDNWNKLANTKVNDLKQILLEAGPRFRMHNPGSWPEQARLADARDWDQLRDFQDNLTGGKV